MCKVDIGIACLPLLIMWISQPQTCQSSPIASNKGGFSQGALSSMSSHQLHALVRDALKYLNKASEEQERAEPKISGLVKLRAIRSGFMEDMANVARLYQLQEIENRFANKARPRFGKRAEVTQDNFLPPYGYQSGEIEDDDEVGRSLHRDDDAAGHVKVPQAFLTESDERQSRRR